MDKYDKISRSYDWLDAAYFSEKGRNPRDAVMEMMPDGPAHVLDLCCGTLSNTLAMAQAKPELEILGVDRSEGMLRAARRKLSASGVKNVRLLRADAANTLLPGETFDCVVIGLVLHENTPAFNTALLGEARRLLKLCGGLIVLEWEPEKTLCRRIKFAPLYLSEILSSGDFKSFYKTDKIAYFSAHGFYAEHMEHCNYSIVLKLKKI